MKMFDWYYRQTIGTMIPFYQKIKSSIRTKYSTREKERQKSKYRFPGVKRRSCVGLREKEEKIAKHLFAKTCSTSTLSNIKDGKPLKTISKA